MSLKDTLTSEELKTVEAARWKAYLLYEGKETAHRSCGISLAETFGLRHQAYQALRKGGLTGEGECGAIKAGELILGEFLGDPSPTGPPTSILREAATLYRKEWIRRVHRGPSGTVPGGGSFSGEVEVVNIVCNHLVQPLGDFNGPDRQRFCTNIASQVAEIVAEILLKAGIPLKIVPVEASKS